MKQALLDKYFNDRCTPQELEQVLSWFQTDEGHTFIEQEIEARKAEGVKFTHRSIDSEKVFNSIQRDKRPQTRKRNRAYLRVASILLLAGLVSYFLFKGVVDDSVFWESEPAYITYVTQEGQHKVIELAGGTTISLNGDSKLVIPEHITDDTLEVKLAGEAFFEIKNSDKQPFLVHALGSTIRDIGTKFNVKTDSLAHTVQVAVLEGKVALKKSTAKAPGAILTANTFGVLNLEKNEIAIRKMDVSNYLSWMNGRLSFNGRTLAEISSQLEYIYGIAIHFETEKLKQIKLTATFDKEKPELTLSIIANTLGIRIEKNDTSYVWMEH